MINHLYLKNMLELKQKKKSFKEIDFYLIIPRIVNLICKMNCKYWQTVEKNSEILIAFIETNNK